MNDNIKAKVIDLLENTPTRIRNIELLRYELKHHPRVSTEEMIEALTFHHADGEGHAPGARSDKTMNVALDYERRAEAANAEIAKEIILELSKLEAEQERLEKYISLLSVQQHTVIRARYFDGKSCKEISEGAGMSLRTTQRMLENGITELCKMYDFVESFNLAR